MLSALFFFLLGSLIHGACAPPPNSSCPQSVAECVAATGCRWDSGSDGRCLSSSTSSCEATPTASACRNIAGCDWWPGGVVSKSCQAPSEEDCILKSETHCNLANSGCSWIPSNNKCSYPEYSECEYLSDKSECEASGCRFTVNQAICSRRDWRDCEELSPQNCNNKAGCEDASKSCHANSDKQNECYQGLSAEDCAAKEYCQFLVYGGSCEGEAVEGQFCHEASDEEACENVTGCQWNVYGNCETKSGYCQYDELGSTCIPASDCSASSDNYNCRPNNELECLENEEKTECSDISITAGCTWKPSYGSCNPNYDLNCATNDAGTDCTEGSDAGCRFKSEIAYCNRSNELKCTENQGNKSCDAASSNNGCKWVEHYEPAQCYRNSGGGEGVICYTNFEGTDCDNESKTAGCTWKASTDPSCVGDTSITCVADGSACSAASIAFGCVWTADSSSIVSIPALLSLLIFLLVASF